MTSHVFLSPNFLYRTVLQKYMTGHRGTSASQCCGYGLPAYYHFRRDTKFAHTRWQRCLRADFFHFFIRIEISWWSAKKSSRSDQPLPSSAKKPFPHFECQSLNSRLNTSGPQSFSAALPMHKKITKNTETLKPPESLILKYTMDSRA